MEVINTPTQQHRSPSTLNPNAPMFVPMSYRSVEDFSDQWWSLVHSSPWFRDYWLRERFSDSQLNNDDIVDGDLVDFDFVNGYDFVEDELFFNNINNFDLDGVEEVDKGIGVGKELVKVGGMAWHKGRGISDLPKYADKAPKFVKPKVSPRPIHQPR